MSGTSEWDVWFWDDLFANAKLKGVGLLISKSAPPNGSLCDHRESVWEFHQATIRRCMKRFGFVVRYETSKIASLGPT